MRTMRMSPNIPAHQALRLQVETSLGRRPDRDWPDWVRSSGRPRNRWIDQLHQDHQRPPADLWRAAIQRGHTGATLRSSTTMRWRRRRYEFLFGIHSNYGDILYRLRDYSDLGLLVENCEIFIPHLYLAPTQGETPSEFREDVWCW